MNLWRYIRDIFQKRLSNRNKPVVTQATESSDKPFKSVFFTDNLESENKSSDSENESDSNELQTEDDSADLVSSASSTADHFLSTSRVVVVNYRRGSLYDNYKLYICSAPIHNNIARLLVKPVLLCDFYNPTTYDIEYQTHQSLHPHRQCEGTDPTYRRVIRRLRREASLWAEQGGVHHCVPRKVRFYAGRKNMWEGFPLMTPVHIDQETTETSHL